MGEVYLIEIKKCKQDTKFSLLAVLHFFKNQFIQPILNAHQISIFKLITQ